MHNKPTAFGTSFPTSAVLKVRLGPYTPTSLTLYTSSRIRHEDDSEAEF
jgi:hypothetical protein